MIGHGGGRLGRIEGEGQRQLAIAHQALEFGAAGGKVSPLAPEMRMQGIEIVPERCHHGVDVVTRGRLGQH